MHRLALLGWTLLTALVATSSISSAQPPTPPLPTLAPAGNADAKGGILAAQPPPNAAIPSCTEQSPNPTTTPPPLSVTVNLATIWQPRGGEVIVAVVGESSLFKGFTVRACFGWSTAKPGTFFEKDNLAHFSPAFVRIRPSDTLGLINLGIVVPDLGNAPAGFVERWEGKAPATGLGIVPIVTMRLIGYNDSGVLFDSVRPVGVTSVTFSFITATVAVVFSILVLYRLIIDRTAIIPAASQNLAGRPQNRVALAVRYIRVLLGLQWLLHLVQRDDGRASLSAFQILLWTLVIADSAIYVMTLSGNLINVTPGALVLLGIAGAAGLVSASQNPSNTAATVDRSLLPSINRNPTWSDLARDEKGNPDVTRLQMLLFTVVTAIFVMIQVINNYIIPDIPSGYLILMGISNGIYVGRKFTGQT